MTRLFKKFAGLFQLLFVVLVVGGAMLMSVSLRPESSGRYTAPAPAAVGVSVVEPVVTAYEPYVSLNGVVAARTVTDVTPQVGGRIITVSPNFRPGAEFAKGEVLFRIEQDDYELAVERTLADIEAARSDLALLEAQAAAEQRVWDQQFSDRKIPDLVAKVPQIAAAKARIHSGEAARDAAQLSLTRTVVRAPFDGRVLETRLDVGQVVNAGQAVGEIFSAGSREISVPVSSAELALLGDVLGRGAEVVRENSAADPILTKVVRQAAQLDESTRLATLFLDVDPSQPLMVGEFVSVKIRGETARDVVRIPAASLTSRDQLWVVDGGIIRERQVDVVGNEGDFAIVRNFDIAEGIVTLPPSDAHDGLLVQVQSEVRVAGGATLTLGAE
jgi:RND family efflux transporter MFP subunit